MKISRDAAWLLAQGNLISDPESIHRRYGILLKSKELANYRGIVSNRKELISQFLNFYPSNILENFDCKFSRSDSFPWLIYLPHNKKSLRLRPVIHHLLFIQFLGYTSEEFFRLSHEFKPFAEGPWPCLNPVCKNFKQTCIEEYSLSYARQTQGRPVGTFQCICGFTYSRLGPDTDYEARWNYSRVDSYGIVWEADLKALWEDPTVSVHKMARRLGIHDKTVKRQAARLNLPLPRQSIRPIGVGAEITRRRSEPPRVDRLQLYRNEWLVVRQNHPEAKLQDLKKLAPRAYDWLCTYDAEWFHENCPSPVRTAIPYGSSRVDWSERDAKWSNAILDAAHRFISSPSRPKQITFAALSREIGELSKIRFNLDKLPLTAKALAEVVETPEQIIIRRIQWVTERYRQENISPTRNQLERRAGVYPKVKQFIQVQEAIAEALSILS